MKGTFLLLLSLFLHYKISNATCQNGENLLVISHQNHPDDINPDLHFDTTTFCFGRIFEAKGPVTHRFVFTNVGKKNLNIEKVLTTCGCTTTQWSKSPIKPGMKGYINATYEVNNRPGGFEKAIFVYSNLDKDSVVLTISGAVICKEKTLQDSFPYESGNIRFKSNTVVFTQLNGVISDTIINIELRNTSGSAITIKSFNTKGNDFIYVASLPVTIPPYSKISLPIRCSPNKIEHEGLAGGEVIVNTDDAKFHSKKMFIYIRIRK